jgi:hypothetical protein
MVNSPAREADVVHIKIEKGNRRKFGTNDKAF